MEESKRNEVLRIELNEALERNTSSYLGFFDKQIAERPSRLSLADDRKWSVLHTAICCDQIDRVLPYIKPRFLRIAADNYWTPLFAALNNDCILKLRPILKYHPYHLTQRNQRGETIFEQCREYEDIISLAKIPEEIAAEYKAIVLKGPQHILTAQDKKVLTAAATLNEIKRERPSLFKLLEEAQQIDTPRYSDEGPELGQPGVEI